MDLLQDEEPLSVRRNVERSDRATPAPIDVNGVRDVEEFNRLAKLPTPCVRHGNGHHRSPSILVPAHISAVGRPEWH